MTDLVQSAPFLVLIVTVTLAIIAGAMRFSSMEARLAVVETVQPVVRSKLDEIAAAVARIEGRMAEQREQHSNERREDRGK
jgi:hypothetical protein